MCFISWTSETSTKIAQPATKNPLNVIIKSHFSSQFAEKFAEYKEAARMAKEKSLDKMELASSPSQVCPVMSGGWACCLHGMKFAWNNRFSKPSFENSQNCYSRRIYTVIVKILIHNSFLQSVYFPFTINFYQYSLTSMEQ